MGHVGQKSGFGVVGDLRSLQGRSKLTAVKLPFRLSLLPDAVLLLPVKIVQGTSNGKRRQHPDHNYEDILIYRSPLLLDGFDWHIAH